MSAIRWRNSDARISLTACDGICQHLEFPGWDVTSFDDQGEELFIEVKGSIGKFVAVLNLTVNEWNAATDPSRAARYYVYLVTDAFSEQPMIERIANPAALVEQGKISCEPIVYSLELRSAQKSRGD
jgi:hypothetical protein